MKTCVPWGCFLQCGGPTVLPPAAIKTRRCRPPRDCNVLKFEPLGIRMACRFTAIILGLCYLAVIGSARAAESPPTFEADVRSVLVEKCGKCHSEKVTKGGLDLSSISAVRRGGDSGEELIAKTVDDSWLWMQIADGEMPPEGEPALTDDELELLRRWIASGAPSMQPAASEQVQLNQHDVLPILLLRCTTCHGPRIQQGDLDLRSRAAMLQGGKRGPAFVAGDADASLMIQRIESQACPPQDQLLKFFVRRPPSSEVAVLRDWIAAGAPEIDLQPDVATTEPDRLVTDEDRQHWAFQPPRSDSRIESIDGFVHRKLRDHDLTFSPQADRDTLIRRAHIDLIGMPPSPEQWQRWRRDDDPSWYVAMIDSLLASPRYGERWGRYWLDLAGYADSEGGISADPVRAVAWKYRDYVIDAFNSDKGYDRFLIEQLAGDELVDYENAPQITDEIVNNLVATGFLRMGIDETGSRTMNFVPERLKVIGDAITVVSSGLMGMTMECARCHSHKYDPIPQRDYYRFKAIFQGALDEHDWSSFKTRSLNVATAEHRRRVAAINPPIQKQIRKLESELKRAVADQQLELLRHHYPDQSEADHQATLVALKKADNNRTLPQKILVERLQRADLLPESQQPESVMEVRARIATLQRSIDRLRHRLVPPLAIRALWDFGRPSPTYILGRGEHTRSGTLVGPGVPSVLTDGATPFEVEPPFPDGTKKTGRRLALANWLTRPDHPLTARVMVNRIWHHHFGVGLVKDLENFGVKGSRPTHPELLDWLALEFVDQGWSIKAMHRMIMCSQTYRQTSRISGPRAELDPQNELLSRMSLRRLDAEALRDSLLQVSGQLDETPGGLPDSVTVSREGMVSANPTDGGGWRRSVYLQYRRTEIETMMDTFDYPQMGPNCIARNVSTVSPQSLMLMNNGQVRQLSEATARRIEQMLADEGLALDSSEQSCDRQLEKAYSLMLSRVPDVQERRLGAEALRELGLAWNQDSKDSDTSVSAARRALETYCHSILNSAAFLYVD